MSSQWLRPQSPIALANVKPGIFNGCYLADCLKSFSRHAFHPTARLISHFLFVDFPTLAIQTLLFLLSIHRLTGMVANEQRKGKFLFYLFGGMSKKTQFADLQHLQEGVR